MQFNAGEPGPSGASGCPSERLDQFLNRVADRVVIIDDENPGALRLSERAYDTRVAGIISGAGDVNADGYADFIIGAHLDDSYLILAGPGLRRGYRRPKPTRITSVAPTLATALGIPVPRDADGTVLWEFFQD